MVSEALSLVSKAEREISPWAKASTSSCRHAGAVFPIAGPFCSLPSTAVLGQAQTLSRGGSVPGGDFAGYQIAIRGFSLSCKPLASSRELGKAAGRGICLHRVLGQPRLSLGLWWDGREYSVAEFTAPGVESGFPSLFV